MKFRISLISILWIIIIGAMGIDVSASEIKSDYKREEEMQVHVENNARYEINQTKKQPIKFDTRKKIVKKPIEPIIQEKSTLPVSQWIKSTSYQIAKTSEKLGIWVIYQSEHYVLKEIQNKIKHEKDTLEGWITFFKDVTTSKSTPRNTEQIREEALGQVYNRLYEWSSPTYATTQLKNTCITKRNVLFSAVQKQLDETTRKQTYF